MSWNSILLSDIADFSNGVNFDKSSYTKGVKLIGVSNFGERFYPNYDELEEIKTDVVRPNDYLQEGDIVFVRSNGNKELVGRCMMIANPPSKVTYSGFCIRCRIKDTSYVLPKFLTYYFKSTAFRNAISGSAIGANIQNLSQGKLASHRFLIPDINIQRRIASILSAYDDLIENNRRQIKLLEEAAQRLYREWFVELRFPGHEGVKVVDGVPEGWTVTTASEVTNVLRRGISPNYDETARLSVISQKCIRQYIVDMNQVRRQSKSFDSSMGLLDSDTVICSTGTGTLGRVGKVFGNHPNCTFDSHVTLVRTNGTVGKHYLNLRMYELREYFDSCKTGSTNQTELSRSIVQNVKVYIADSHTQKIFEKIEEAYHQKMMICQHQIQLLTETRDRLLPKLMNGEMEV